MASRWLYGLVRSDAIAAGLVLLAMLVPGEPVRAGEMGALPLVTSSTVAPNPDGKDSAARAPKPFPSAVSFNLWSGPSQGQGWMAQVPHETAAPAEPLQEAPGDELSPATDLDLDPAVIRDSPVLQRWLQEVPDIADEIRNQPSFRTRFRVGYAQFPSTHQASGIHLGIEDIFIVPGSGLTASGSFNRSWNNDRESFGAEARYYLFPLGGYVNLAPTVGYRSLETPEYTTNGLDLGIRLLFVPSRGGGADMALSQHWVAPGSPEEVAMTSISVGYAVTSRLRLGTDVEFQNSRSGQESRLGLVLEWLM